MDSKGQPPQYASPAAGQQPQFAAQAQPHPYAAAPAQPQPAYQGEPAVDQYRSAPPMQVGNVGGKPGWQSSLMDCTPCDTCCLGTFLPCILLGQTSDRMRDPTMATADSCNSDCMILCAVQYFTGCGWVYVMIKRSEIRERFGIDGSGTGDCCATYWCPCCALIQQEKEVIARTQVQPTVQGYQAQPAMQVPQGKN